MGIHTGFQVIDVVSTGMIVGHSVEAALHSDVPRTALGSGCGIRGQWVTKKSPTNLLLSEDPRRTTRHPSIEAIPSFAARLSMLESLITQSAGAELSLWLDTTPISTIQAGMALIAYPSIPIFRHPLPSTTR